MRPYLHGLELIVLSAFFDSFAAFVVKLKFNQWGPLDFSSATTVISTILKFLKSPLLIIALIGFFLAPGLWFLALQRVDLSLGYPAIVGFHLLFVLIFGIFFLGESLTPSKCIGILLSLSSLYFLFKPA